MRDDRHDVKPFVDNVHNKRKNGLYAACFMAKYKDKLGTKYHVNLTARCQQCCSKTVDHQQCFVVIDANTVLLISPTQEEIDRQGQCDAENDAAEDDENL